MLLFLGLGPDIVMAHANDNHPKSLRTPSKTAASMCHQSSTHWTPTLFDLPQPFPFVGPSTIDINPELDTHSFDLIVFSTIHHLFLPSMIFTSLSFSLSLTLPYVGLPRLIEVNSSTCTLIWLPLIFFFFTIPTLPSSPSFRLTWIFHIELFLFGLFTLNASSWHSSLFPISPLSSKSFWSNFD